MIRLSSINCINNILLSTLHVSQCQHNLLVLLRLPPTNPPLKRTSQKVCRVSAILTTRRSENGDRVAPYIASLVYFRQTPSFINLSNLAGHFTFLARPFITPLILYLIPPPCSCQASANLYVRRRRTGRAKGRMGQFYQESCSYDGRSQLDDRSSM